jgi:hypothetical protein
MIPQALSAALTTLMVAFGVVLELIGLYIGAVALRDHGNWDWLTVTVCLGSFAVAGFGVLLIRRALRRQGRVIVFGVVLLPLGLCARVFWLAAHGGSDGSYDAQRRRYAESSTCRAWSDGCNICSKGWFSNDTTCTLQVCPKDKQKFTCLVGF